MRLLVQNAAIGDPATFDKLDLNHFEEMMDEIWGGFNVLFLLVRWGGWVFPLKKMGMVKYNIIFDYTPEI